MAAFTVGSGPGRRVDGHAGSECLTRAQGADVPGVKLGRLLGTVPERLTMARQQTSPAPSFGAAVVRRGLNDVSATPLAEEHGSRSLTRR